MRAEILREREKRRAAMKGSMPYGNDGRASETRSGEPTEKRAIADPARARVAAAIARLESLNPNPSSQTARFLTLCRIACNACEDAFGDTAPTFANPENAFALATESEKNAAETRVDRRSVKLANAKVREAFFGVREPSHANEAAVSGDESSESSPAVDAFVAAGFVLENDAATDVSRDEDFSLTDKKNREASVDARRLTLPYTADVRLVSFLAERLATVAAAASPLAAPLAAKAARLAAPGYRKARAVDPTKPPAGGRGARAFVPPAGGSAAARAQLDDAFFRRDASEVAAEFARAKAAREASSALTTRAWKEARKKEEEEEEKKTKRTDPVTVRVRLPDGTQLRGMFGPREPIGAVRAFVHESLREPFRRFDLAFLGAPLRGDEGDEGDETNGAKAAKPRDSLAGLRTHNVRASGLGSGSVSSKGARLGHKGVGYGEEGTVAGAGLAPSALITFSWAEPARPGENTDGDPRVLNDALSGDAQPLE